MHGIAGSRSWFTLAYLAGIAIMAWLFFAIALPLLISLGGWAWGRLASAALGSLGFWEALFVAIYAGAELRLPVALALREWSDATKRTAPVVAKGDECHRISLSAVMRAALSLY